VDTDLSAARAASLDAALVLSGGTKREALNGFEPEPVAVTDTLADLLLN
jgi:ribonucleotide monophosphatase NagD (HAD superfamily)